MTTRGISSRYVVENAHKYVGDASAIICRSTWERAFCFFCDKNTNVEYFASEEVVVPYMSPKDGRMHRYFIDFFVQFTNGQKLLIEIKPYVQTIPPKPPKKKTQKAINRYIEACQTYEVNSAKWEYASRYASKNNAKFVVYTENDLRDLGIKI